MSYFKKILIYFLCLLPLTSCNDNRKKDYFIGLDKITLWNQLCQKSNIRSGIIYAKDYPKNIKGDVSITLMVSKTNSIPEIFMKANKWKWQPAEENLRYTLIFDRTNKVTDVSQRNMK